MDLFPLVMLGLGASIALGMVVFVFAGPSPQRAQARRISSQYLKSLAARSRAASSSPA